MKKKFAIIVNPVAGNGKTFKLLPRFKKVADDIDADFDYHITQYRRHATILADKIHKEYDAVIAFGGDGTANEVMNGLAGTTTPFGLIPVGRGNDFARSINIPNNVKDAVKVIVDYKIKTMDLGTIDERVFINGIGIGFDGYVNLRNQNKRFFRGEMSYLITVLTSLAAWHAVPVELFVDEDFRIVDSAFLVAVGNGNTCGGGLKLNPQASVHDGVFDICYIKDVSKLKVIANLNRLKNGTIGEIEEVELFRGKNITIKSEQNLPIHFDGEVYQTDKKEIQVKVIPHSASVICG